MGTKIQHKQPAEDYNTLVRNKTHHSSVDVVSESYTSMQAGRKGGLQNLASASLSPGVGPLQASLVGPEVLERSKAPTPFHGSEA